MTRATSLRLLIAFLACAPVAAARAGSAETSIRCPDGIVRIGDGRVDLLGKCGEPALREARPVEAGAAVVRAAPPLLEGAAATVTVEQWTFNFGPNRFVQVVTLESGRVVAIERGGYGYDPEKLRARRAEPPCESSAIRVGDRKLDLLARCGEPDARDVRTEKRAATLPADAADAAAIAFTSVAIETWTYDLGPQRFITFATIEDGKVVAVEHGGYGYRRR